MTLEELEAEKAEDIEVVDGEFCEAGDDTDTLEEDLTTALEHLDTMLRMMEQITVKQRRIVTIPNAMEDVMRDVAEFLNQFENVREEETGEF